MTQDFDLFDHLNAQDAPDVVHMILPSFITACGREFLDVSRDGQLKGKRLYTLSSPEVTCAECLTAGKEHGSLSALCQQIMSNQAPARGAAQA